MMPSPYPLCKYEGSNVLLVEGSNDCHVVMSLCNIHDVPETFGLYECGGKEQVLKRLNALIVQPESPQTIGVILDADSGVDDRWISIKAKLRHYAYPFPALPETQGTIIEAQDTLPRLGFWLMPNNQMKGMLEDFCLEMIEQRAHETAQAAVENAQAEGICTFQATHFSKAIVHTYLAWQDEPGRPLGQAITCQALRPHTETAQAFIEWLNRLFNPI
jgi:hypothetical protein